jgi:uncharacterized protein YjbJ (UPF0337 family)
MADGPSNMDEAKGRLKQGAGDLTGDDDLKREGKADEGAGKVKEGVDKVTDKVKDVLGRDKDA